MKKGIVQHSSGCTGGHVGCKSVRAQRSAHKPLIRIAGMMLNIAEQEQYKTKTVTVQPVTGEAAYADTF